MESNVDIRLTPFTNLRTQPKITIADDRSRFADFNKSHKTKPKRLFLSITPKKNLNNILVLSKKSITLQPIVAPDKKGVSLYQQVERNKLFSNGTELINRFHFKV